MKKLALFVATAILSLTVGAHAQTVASVTPTAQQSALECTPVSDVKPADAGYKRIGIRSPKANVNGARVTVMQVQISMPVAQARTDAGLEQAKIEKIYDCKSNVGFVAKAESLPDYDATEIVVPETIAKGTKVQVCSKSVGCAAGTFESFDKWVTLTVSAPSSDAKIVGKYN